MNIFLTFVYVFLLFYNIISNYIPYASYIDEGICIFTLIIAFIVCIKNGGIIKLRKYYKELILCLVMIFLIGFVSTVRYQYVLSILAIFKDCVLVFKFFITYISCAYIIRNYKSVSLEKYVIGISKIILTIIFIFGIISIVKDIGMGSQVRYGLRSYQFLYSHYTFLVYNVVVLLSTINCEAKKNYSYKLMGIIILILTLRTKAFMFAALYALMEIFMLVKNKKDIDLKKYINAKTILTGILVVFLVAYKKIQEYISWGATYNLRNGLYVKGLKIALDHFPLGSGFCTFGTNLSYKVSLKLYSMYNLLSYQGFDTGVLYLSDVFWPSIYAQYGLLGFIFYVMALYYLIKIILKNEKNLRTKINQSQLYIIVYLILASIAEASFTNDIGVFSIIFIIIYSCFAQEESKKLKKE